MKYVAYLLVREYALPQVVAFSEAVVDQAFEPEPDGSVLAGGVTLWPVMVGPFSMLAEIQPCPEECS